MDVHFELLQFKENIKSTKIFNDNPLHNISKELQL